MQAQLHLTFEHDEDQPPVESGIDDLEESVSTESDAPDCWRLDARTRTVGKVGIARARVALNRARANRVAAGADAA